MAWIEIGKTLVDATDLILAHRIDIYNWYWFRPNVLRIIYRKRVQTFSFRSKKELNQAYERIKALLKAEVD